MKIRGQIVYAPSERIERLSIPEPNSGCWLWIGTLRSNANGLSYGRLVVNSRTDGSRKSVAAHRYSYETHVGAIPVGMNVLHRCDNPSCVNPEHLHLGTQRENMIDCFARGRLKNQWGHCPTPPGDDK